MINLPNSCFYCCISCMCIHFTTYLLCVVILAVDHFRTLQYYSFPMGHKVSDDLLVSCQLFQPGSSLMSPDIVCANDTAN